MSLAFLGWLIVGRMPGIGYAHDHEISLLAASLVAGLFCAIELLAVHGTKHVPGLRVVHRKVTQPNQKAAERWGDSGRLAMIGLPAAPAGGGSWIAYWLGLKLGLPLWQVVSLVAGANAVYFGLYFKYAGGIAWYVAAAFALAALVVALPKAMRLTADAYRRLSVRLA